MRVSVFVFAVLHNVRVLPDSYRVSIVLTAGPFPAIQFYEAISYHTLAMVPLKARQYLMNVSFHLPDTVHGSGQRIGTQRFKHPDLRPQANTNSSVLHVPGLCNCCSVFATAFRTMLRFWALQPTAVLKWYNHFFSDDEVS